MAICPTQSIQVDGLSYTEHFCELPHRDLADEPFFDLLIRRRSVRAFKDTPVPREMLEKIVEAISLAPMSFPPHKVHVTVAQSREVLERALPSICELYEDLGRRMDNPLARFVIRRKAGQEAFNSLRNHVLPSLAFRLPDMKAGQGDPITRGAPSMLVFHAWREAGGRTADGWIALTYGLLAAHALGLGATAIGLVPPAIERSPELRALFEIPPGNQVLAAMIVGFPRYHYQRGIRRELASVNWI
jgi:nitroreductase